MLQPTPTLPIPGQKQDPNYSLSIGFGGIVQVNFTVTSQNGMQYETIDCSNLVATFSDSTSKQGYTIVTSTNLVDIGQAIPGILIKSTWINTNNGPNGTTYQTYDAYGCWAQFPINSTLLIASCEAVTSLSCTAVYNIIIRLMTVQYQYPTTFTQEELFEDLKTLPEVVVTELKKLDCEKMQGALSLLESFNAAKLIS